MLPELKKRWLTALRDGSYTQGIGSLRGHEKESGGPGFCCLGVLCDLIDPNKWNEIESELEGEKAWAYDHCATGHLPELLRKEVGLNRDVQEDASSKNDQEESFKKIATWLERLNLETGYRLLKQDHDTT